MVNLAGWQIEINQNGMEQGKPSLFVYPYANGARCLIRPCMEEKGQGKRGYLENQMRCFLLLLPFAPSSS